ncbi:Caleosin related domain containing protein [Naviculisporaceae sp. PSN 640]
MSPISIADSNNSSSTAHVEDDPLAAVNFDLSAAKAPVTAQRKQAVDAEAYIERPSIARANLAVSSSHSNGSEGEYADNLKDYSVLQQHVLFWDRDSDGTITPFETYRGFRDIGFSILFSILAALIINGGFSYVTRIAYSYIPDPFFRVYVGSIHLAKHGSDSGVYDREGRFVPQAFEDMFARWDTNNEGALSGAQLFNLIRGNRLAVDPFGWSAAVFEFGTTWLLLQKDGKVSKEDLRQTYDGSIFWRIREARQSGKGWDKGFGLRDLVDLGRHKLKSL